MTARAKGGKLKHKRVYGVVCNSGEIHFDGFLGWCVDVIQPPKNLSATDARCPECAPHRTVIYEAVK